MQVEIVNPRTVNKDFNIDIANNSRLIGIILNIPKLNKIYKLTFNAETPEEAKEIVKILVFVSENLKEI